MLNDDHYRYRLSRDTGQNFHDRQKVFGECNNEPMNLRFSKKGCPLVSSFFNKPSPFSGTSEGFLSINHDEVEDQ
jgi:hypothetical protein